jgi:hypothetical protein
MPQTGISAWGNTIYTTRTMRQYHLSSSPGEPVSNGLQLQYAKRIIYGPPALFGIGVHDLYIEQGIHQLLALFGHIWQNSDTSKMM